MDIEMPGPDPFEAIRDLKRQYPNARVIMLSGFVRDHFIDAAIGAGAWGYISKTDEPSKVMSAIRSVARGELVFSDEVVERTSRKGSRAGVKTLKSTSSSKLRTLTHREQEVLTLIGKGVSRSQISKSLHRSPKTIDAHRASIMEKLDIHDRVELALFAVREGLVDGVKVGQPTISSPTG